MILKKNIPDKIVNFNLYKEGKNLVGVGDEVSLPSFEPMTSTLSGAGILGEIETATLGYYGSQDMEIPFRMTDEDYFLALSPLEPLDLTIRGAAQRIKGDSGLEQVGVRAVMRGLFKGMEFGKVKAGEPMEAKIKIEITYYLFELDGQKRIELDKLNSVYKVNGKDVLEKVRKLC